MNQLVAIRAFARVVEAGSFTRAAEGLEMPTATLSKVVRELETHLGVRLLERTTRRVAVTAEGVVYYEKAGRILRDLEDVDASFGASGGSPRGLLRVDVGNAIARDVLVPALPTFLARHPDIRIELGVSDKAVNLISENVDCAIRGGPLDDGSLVARHLGDADIVTCASPAYLETFGRPTHPDDLRGDYPLVSYLSPTHGRAFPFRFQHEVERLELNTQHRVGINESNACLAAGLAGLGIVQAFAFAARTSLRSGALVEVLRDWRPAPYPFHVVYPNNRNVSHRLRLFIDWMTQALPQTLN